MIKILRPLWQHCPQWGDYLIWWSTFPATVDSLRSPLVRTITEYIAKQRPGASPPSLAIVLCHCFLIAEKSATCRKSLSRSVPYSSVFIIIWSAVDTGWIPYPWSGLRQIECSAWRWQLNDRFCASERSIDYFFHGCRVQMKNFVFVFFRTLCKTLFLRLFTKSLIKN